MLIAVHDVHYAGPLPPTIIVGSASGALFAVHDVHYAGPLLPPIIVHHAGPFIIMHHAGPLPPSIIVGSASGALYSLTPGPPRPELELLKAIEQQVRVCV